MAETIEALTERMEQLCKGTLAYPVTTFVGPFTWCVGRYRYIVLSSYGIKAEGEPPRRKGQRKITDQGKAVEAFMRRFANMLREQRPVQMAWRRRPSFSELNGEECVTARFALICETPNG